MVRIKESVLELQDNTFYAAWDDITTTTAWNRPELHNLIKWRDTLFNLHNGLEGINVYLVGGYAEFLYKPQNPLTWDVDVCFIVEESVDYKRIKRILDDSLKIALEVGILLDQKAITPYTHSFFQSLYSGVVPEYNNDKIIYFKNFKSFEKIINGNIVVAKSTSAPPNMEFENVYPGLYKVFGMNKKLIDKVINKFKKGIYTGRLIDLKNTDFNFTT